MNSSHPEIETISAYLDGEVTSRERAQVEQHLASCASCGAITQKMRTASRTLAALGPVQMTADEHRALRQTLLGATPGRASSRWSLSRLQWSLAGAFAVLAVAVVGFAFMRSIPTHNGGQSLTEAMAPADGSVSPIKIDSDDQIRGTVLALPEVRGSISRSTAGSRSAKAAPEAPAALPEPEAARDSATAQSNGGAETFAGRSGGDTSGSGGDGGGGGASGASGAFAGATSGGTEAAAFTPEAGARCLAAFAATQADPVEPIVAREISYKGQQAWLVVYAARASDGSIEEIRSFVVGPGDCATLSGTSLEIAALGRSAFKP